MPAKSRAILLVVILGASVFAGCVGGEEAESDPIEQNRDEGFRDEDPVPPTTWNPPGNSSEDPPTGGVTPRDPPPPPPAPAVSRRPMVVLALVDEGINPYHEQFRDMSDLARVHPSKYIDGYPAHVRSLNLSFDAPTYEEARRRDAQVWGSVEPGELVWIPGTRIVGAISFRIPVTGPFTESVGHGSMTAGRAAGRDTSLAPEARIVAIQGLGGEGVRWAADQGWIDVQTNSWLSIVPPPANQHLPFDADGTTNAFRHAQDKMVVLAASGNGAAYFTGFAPTPTWLLSTAAPGVILVGAHDNGHVAAWSGAPAHIVADGYGGLTVNATHLTQWGASGEACCTSASAPYAAGAAARLVLEARRLVGDTGTGLRDGALVRGTAGLVPSGPLADGILTLEEFRGIFLWTATPRPNVGIHDGFLHPYARGEPPSDPTQPGANPYCHGCWTLPVAYRDLPDELATYPLNGYGAIDDASLLYARAVLAGFAQVPSREAEDRFFDFDSQVRDVVFRNALDELANLGRFRLPV